MYLNKYSIYRNGKGMLKANDGEVPTFGELVLSTSCLNPCGVWTVERAYIVETRGIVTDLRNNSSGLPVEVVGPSLTTSTVSTYLCAYEVSYNVNIIRELDILGE